MCHVTHVDFCWLCNLYGMSDRPISNIQSRAEGEIFYIRYSLYYMLLYIIIYSIFDTFDIYSCSQLIKRIYASISVDQKCDTTA